ncbi:MAG: signal recognition particle-docking protein FtsY [Pseudomonadota bacterium]
MGLFSFRKKKAQNDADTSEPKDEALGNKLTQTRSTFASRVVGFLRSAPKLDDELLEELEDQLISADVGVDATQHIVAELTNRASQGDPVETLAGILREMLQVCEQPLQIESGQSPFVILVVGVNGAGKTTTIGKIANQLQAGGLSVMLAAGDTFRAAAIEQLQTWGERNHVPVVAQQQGSDSASVIYDAIESARARGVDVLIADTAGRLHTQAGLMDELAKVRRVIGKVDETAPHETLLVLDGGTGQNALRQAREFTNALSVSGLAITKLDGTAKGGVLFSLARELGLPVRFIGVGESVDDLRVFDAAAFVDALLGLDTSE